MNFEFSVGQLLTEQNQRVSTKLCLSCGEKIGAQEEPAGVEKQHSSFGDKAEQGAQLT